MAVVILPATYCCVLQLPCVLRLKYPSSCHDIAADMFGHGAEPLPIRTKENSLNPEDPNHVSEFSPARHPGDRPF
jgi:hypothetical protein